MDLQQETGNSVLLAAQDDQIQPINDQIEGKAAIHKTRQKRWGSEIQQPTPRLILGPRGETACLPSGTMAVFFSRSQPTISQAKTGDWNSHSPAWPQETLGAACRNPARFSLLPWCRAKS